MPDSWDPTILSAVGAMVIACLVGFLTGLFGVGGGFLLTPALIIILGVPTPLAVGLSLYIMLFSSSLGILKRRGSGTVDMKLALTMGCGSIAGALLGVQILEVLEQMPKLLIRQNEHVAVQYILLWAFLVLIAGIAMYMVYDFRRNQTKPGDKRVGYFARIRIPPYGRFHTLEEPRLSLVPVVLLGGVIGTLSGLMGIGGGVIMLPALVYLVGQHTAKAAGTSLIVVWITALIASASHLLHGNFNGLLFGGMLIGGLVGTHFGTILGLRLSGSKLRLYFVFVLLGAMVLVGTKIVQTTFF